MENKKLAFGAVELKLITVMEKSDDGSISRYPAFAGAVPLNDIFSEVPLDADATADHQVPLYKITKIRPKPNPNDTRVDIEFDIKESFFYAGNATGTMTLKAQELAVMLALQSSGVNGVHVPVLFVDKEQHSIYPRKSFTLDMASFALMLPSQIDENHNQVVRGLVGAINDSVMDPAGVIFAQDNNNRALAHLESLARTLALTYSLGKGDVSALREAINAEKMIDDADTFIESADLSQDEKIEILLKTMMFGALMGAYYDALNNAPSAEIPVNTNSVDAPNLQEMEDFYQIISASELSDTFTRVISDLKPGEGGREISIEAALERWQTPLSVSWPEQMHPIRDFLAEHEDGEIYDELIDLDFSNTDLVDAALEKFGRGRMTTALAISLAGMAVKHAEFTKVHDDNPDYPFMAEIIEWLDDPSITGNHMWEFLALRIPYASYDISLAKELLMIEQRKYNFSKSGEVANPRHIIAILVFIGKSILTSDNWDTYDFSLLENEAKNFEVNVDGFQKFMDWFPNFLMSLKAMQKAGEEAGMGEDQAIAQAVISGANNEIRQNIENLQELAQNAAFIIPFVSDFIPYKNGFEVGSNEWINSRRQCILESLLLTASVFSGGPQSE